MFLQIKEVLFRILTKLFLPSLARNMEQEGTFQMFEGGSAITDENEYFRIYDNGADVTIFVFSGMDVLFAGEPRFEFRKQLEGIGHPTNFVFIRELRRTAYHNSPSGESDGLEYYTRKVDELKRQLGARVNIAMGASGGGSAAFYFGTRCGFDHVIGFSPAFPETVWTGLGNQLRAIADLGLLFTRPLDYFEVILVALAANVIKHTLNRTIPPDRMWDVYPRYRDANPRPTGTIIYGERCRPDAAQAEICKTIAGVHLMPLATGRHNGPGFLKERGELADTLTSEIRTVLRRLDVPLAPAPSLQDRPVDLQSSPVPVTE
ncbi:MAG: hypothetical protein HUU46_19355 [Candidatus Hydrogenedentes bacterium]|nr:hypothetical protein [Candidatus Hydrogenedentota bacterium]